MDPTIAAGVFALAGVAVSQMFTIITEVYKSKRDRAAKKRDDQREAIKKILAHVAVMERYSFRVSWNDREDLLSDLRAIDLLPYEYALVPSDVHELALRIVQLADSVRASHGNSREIQARLHDVQKEAPVRFQEPNYNDLVKHWTSMALEARTNATNETNELKALIAQLSKRVTALYELTYR